MDTQTKKLVDVEARKMAIIYTALHYWDHNKNDGVGSESNILVRLKLTGPADDIYEPGREMLFDLLHGIYKVTKALEMYNDYDQWTSRMFLQTMCDKVYLPLHLSDQIKHALSSIDSFDNVIPGGQVGLDLVRQFIRVECAPFRKLYDRMVSEGDITQEELFKAFTDSSFSLWCTQVTNPNTFDTEVHYGMKSYMLKTFNSLYAITGQ